MRTSRAAVMRKETIEKLKERFRLAAIDETVTHDEIRKMIPSSLFESDGPYLLVSKAWRQLNKENGAVFATERNIGYRRLTNTQGAKYASDVGLMRIRRRARQARVVATLAIQFANDATDSERRQVNQRIASLGLIEHITMVRQVNVMPEDPPEGPKEAALRGLSRLLGGK